MSCELYENSFLYSKLNNSKNDNTKILCKNKNKKDYVFEDYFKLNITLKRISDNITYLDITNIYLEDRFENYPQYLRHMRVGENCDVEFNFKNLPLTCESLIFECENYYFNIDNIPDNIINLKYPLHYFHFIEKLPLNLVRLHLPVQNEYFAVSSDNLPINLDEIFLGNMNMDFNVYFENTELRPDTIIQRIKDMNKDGRMSIYLPKFFSHFFNKYKKNKYNINFNWKNMEKDERTYIMSDSYNKYIKLGMISENIENLYLGQKYNRILIPGLIPDNVVKIVFGDDFNQYLKKGDLPITLRYIKFGKSFNRPIVQDLFPKTMEEIHFGDNFNQTIRGLIPVNVKRLTLGEDFNMYDDIDLPINLVELKVLTTRVLKNKLDKFLPINLQRLWLKNMINIKKISKTMVYIFIEYEKNKLIIYDIQKRDIYKIYKNEYDEYEFFDKTIIKNMYPKKEYLEEMIEYISSPKVLKRYVNMGYTIYDSLSLIGYTIPDFTIISNNTSNINNLRRIVSRSKMNIFCTCDQMNMSCLNLEYFVSCRMRNYILIKFPIMRQILHEMFMEDISAPKRIDICLKPKIESEDKDVIMQNLKFFIQISNSFDRYNKGRILLLLLNYLFNNYLFLKNNKNIVRLFFDRVMSIMNSSQEYVIMENILEDLGISIDHALDVWSVELAKLL